MAEVIEVYAGTGVSGSDPSTAVPGVAAGDRIVVIATDIYVASVGVVSHNGGANVTMAEIGSALGDGGGEANAGMRAWLITATSALSSITLTLPATNESTITAVHCRGVGAVAAFSDHSVARNQSPAAAQALGPATAPSGGGLAIGAWSGVQFSGTLTWSQPAGMTEEVDTNVASVHACMVATEVVTAGAVSRSSTGSPTPDAGFAGKLIVLSDEGGAPPAEREQIDVSLVGAGPWVAGAASISPAYPTGTAEGDLLFLVTANKTSNAVGNGQIPDPTPPAGWTLLTSWWTSSLSQSFAEGAGRIRMCVFWRFAPASPSGTITVTQPSGTGFVLIGHMRGYRGVPGGRANMLYDYQLATIEQNTTATSWSGTTSTMNLSVKDKLALILASNDDTAFNSGGMSRAGTTLTTLALSPSPSIVTTTGYDLSGAAYASEVTAGGGDGGVAYTAGLAATEAGLGAILRVRATAEVLPSAGFEPGRMLLAG